MPPGGRWRLEPDSLLTGVCFNTRRYRFSAHRRHSFPYAIVRRSKSMLSLPAVFSRRLISFVAVAMSVFHLYVAFVGPPDAYVFRGTHLAFALVLAFLLMPGRYGTADRVGWFDVLLVLASAVAALYPSMNLTYIQNRMYYVDDPIMADYVFGGMAIVLILEATRRATGWALPITAMVFLVYGLTIGNQSVGIMFDQLYLTTEGIFGIPLYVSATYVMLFILFGAFVERSGAGQLFMDFALALAGHTSGGPAKVAVITSSLFGTVSGSAVANVMTTGTFTIPLMTRTGYRPAFSGAVEAVASTGGQLMPPIVGAAAFVMAEFLGVSYMTVAGFAILPAVLYYEGGVHGGTFRGQAHRSGRGAESGPTAPAHSAGRARPPVSASGRDRRRSAVRVQRGVFGLVRHRLGDSDDLVARHHAQDFHAARDHGGAGVGCP